MSMIQVLGNTYRINCVKQGTYEAVRLLDDVRIGSFGGGPSLQLDLPVGADAGPVALLRQIAQTAIRSAKTNWVPCPAVAVPVVVPARGWLSYSLKACSSL